jgi:hypothetical protein
MTILDKIRNLNDLQLCHFLNMIQGDLELVGLAVSDNPEIYCSDDGFSTSMPKSIPEESSSYYWYRCLSKEWKYD